MKSKRSGFDKSDAWPTHDNFQPDFEQYFTERLVVYWKALKTISIFPT
jgi:hypothetical protein